MNQCKRCGSEGIVKNGMVRGRQRYRCRACAYNFIEGDRRVNDALPAKKALAVLLYSLGKASLNMLGHIFGVSRSLTYRWIVEAAVSLPEPQAPGTIKEMEFDEMWHFIGSKKTNVGSSRPWIVAEGEPWHGCSVVVMLRLSNDYTAKSNI
jgi:transposase-like protein